MTVRTLALTATLLLGTSLGALAHDPAPDTAMDAAARKTELFKPGVSVAREAPQGALGEGRPPLYAGLGDMTMPITTDSEAAQAYFDQGLRLAWAFNHAEALRAFKEAQRQDPSCAMCYWGEAFVRGPNINDGMHEDAIGPAYAAVARAVDLGVAATRKERDLIGALAKRYAPEADADRAALDQAWAEAMRGVAHAHPDDAHVRVLLADALMNLQPWDYWEADGRTPKGGGGEIVANLERALDLDPDNPAAAHLYIHAVEASKAPERAEAAADALRGATPAAGHLVHMPSHIYNRIGRFADSIAVNRAAAKADEDLLAQVGDAASPLYRYGYYPHNVHFLMVAAQMAGVAGDVLDAADKLADVTSNEVAKEIAWTQAILTAPYSAHAQFSEPKTILALDDPGETFPFVKGFWHYARGVALAHKGDLGGAWREAGAIQALIDTADMSGLEAQYLPARDVLGVAKHVVEARIEAAAGDYKAALHHAEEAVALEDTLPYMEPPYWYYPVRQTLGAILLQDGRPREAAAAFEAALDQQPRNAWALWGLFKAKEAMGDAGAKAAQKAFETAWLGDRSLLRLDRL